MKKKRFRCRCCRKMRPVRVKNQKYCSDPKCRQARKNAWNTAKYASDPDYRANQKASTETWLRTQGGSAVYFREYRRRRKREEEPPGKSDSLADKQEVSAEEESGFASKISVPGKSANMDSMFLKRPLKSGRYVMFCDQSSSGANRDPYLVEIAVISRS